MESFPEHHFDELDPGVNLDSFASQHGEHFSCVGLLWCQFEGPLPGGDSFTDRTKLVFSLTQPEKDLGIASICL
ncbi:MAG: hypothetical protein ACYS4W_15040 [Planctomycetota bacterium]